MVWRGVGKLRRSSGPNFRKCRVADRIARSPLPRLRFRSLDRDRIARIFGRASTRRGSTAAPTPRKSSRRSGFGLDTRFFGVVEGRKGAPDAHAPRLRYRSPGRPRISLLFGRAGMRWGLPGCVRHPTKLPILRSRSDIPVFRGSCDISRLRDRGHPSTLYPPLRRSSSLPIFGAVAILRAFAAPTARRDSFRYLRGPSPALLTRPVGGGRACVDSVALRLSFRSSGVSRISRLLALAMLHGSARGFGDLYRDAPIARRIDSLSISRAGRTTRRQVGCDFISPGFPIYRSIS